MRLSDEAVTLRSLERSDAAALYRLSVLHDLSSLTTPYWRPWSLRDFENLVAGSEHHETDAPTRVRLGIALQAAPDQLLGLAELHKIDWRHGRAELGVTIWPPDARSKGTGKRSMRLLCDWAFSTLRLRRLEARTFSTNLAAQRLFLSLGFSEEGRFRDYYWVDGRAIDALVFGMLVDEWA